MPTPFRWETGNGYVFEAVVLSNDRSPFTEWFDGLDGSVTPKVFAGLEACANAEASQQGGHAAGRISRLNDDLNELRITKKGRPRGPHLRAVIPRERVEPGGTFWLLSGFKKQTDAIDDRDIGRAQAVFEQWRNE